MSNDRRKSKRKSSVDRREHLRSTVKDHPCWVRADSESGLRECCLTNISKSGATIILDGRVAIPDTFELYFVQSGTIGRKCRAIWREENKIGLQFMGWIAPPSSFLTRGMEMDPV
jgi:hypothetical protein